MGNTLWSLLVRGAFLIQMRCYQSNFRNFRKKIELKISYLSANFENQILSKGGTTKRELRIFAPSLAIVGVGSTQQGEELDQYMQGTDSVVGERKLSLIVHYKQEEQTPQAALIALIKGCIVQGQVRTEGGAYMLGNSRKSCQVCTGKEITTKAKI